MTEKEKLTKLQIAKLFAVVLFGLGIVFTIQIAGMLGLKIFGNNADWLVWTLSLMLEAIIIVAFTAPFLWRLKSISSKQYNYWTLINLGLWIVWIIATGVWYYFSGCC